MAIIRKAVEKVAMANRGGKCGKPLGRLNM